MKITKDEKVRGIQEAALKLFALRGYENTTLEAIAEDLGYTKQALYYYFKNKEDLVRSILMGSLEEAGQNMDRIFANELNPLQQLQALIELYVDDYFTRQSFFNVYHQTMRFQENILNVTERETLVAKRADMVQRIIGLMERGIDQGVFKNIGAHHLGALLLGMISGVLSHREMPGLKDVAPDVLKKNMLEIFMNGILRKEE